MLYWLYAFVLALVSTALILGAMYFGAKRIMRWIERVVGDDKCPR